MSTDQQANQSNWQPIHEPGQPKVNRNLLCRIDPGRMIVEFVRRKRKTIVDLLDYLSIDTMRTVVKAHDEQVLVYHEQAGDDSKT